MHPSDRSPSKHPPAGCVAHPLLCDFATRLNIATPPASSIEETITSLAKQVRWRRPSAVVRFTIAEREHVRSWFVDLSRQSCEAGENRSQSADLEIMTTEDVWLRMMSGELAPLDAFGLGKMRVRGSVEIARALVRALCAV